MMRRATSSGSRAGFTLLELSIGVLLMTSMILIAGLATERAMSMFRQRRARETVVEHANRLLQRVTAELEFARRDALVPNPLAPMGSSTLTYQTSAGVAGGEVVWSASRTLALEYEPGELDDGLDNNGNGLVDESAVVLTENPGQPGEKRVLLGHNVPELLAGEQANGADDNANGLTDEGGLSFAAQGSVLTIRLTVEGQGPSGATITKTLQTSVSILN